MAADLCVNESGSGGCFSTITAAIAAANDGDRILIQPKAGNAPYVEVLNINKSIQLLSNQEGVMWGLAGTVTITPAIGRNISILHMRSNTGNITASGNSPAGPRCKVNIMNCELLNGYINFNYDNFNVNVVSTIISNGYVALKYGNIIGNDMTAADNNGLFYNPVTTYSFIYLGTDAVSTNDTLYIVGNKMRCNAANVCNVSYSGITLNSTSQYFYLSNNLWLLPNAGSSCSAGITGVYINNVKNSSIGQNNIINNTFYSTNSSYFYGIYITNHPANGTTNLLNNLILNTSSGTWINSVYVSSNSGVISASYNYSDDLFYNLVNNGTNNLNSNSTINTSTGQINTGSDGINGGFPDLTYYDLDLTVNDVGAYGGSFSLTNFHPITGAARVYFVKAPRAVLQSGTLNIKAEAFDR
jgi:hypothetical protein